MIIVIIIFFYHNNIDSVFYIENDDDAILEFWVEVGGRGSGSNTTETPIFHTKGCVAMYT
jgi:hypothetical protein